MPTLSTATYPIPKSWDEFEDICLSVCKIKWGNEDFQRNGRQGQKQNGVDIYGKNKLRKDIGIQCKNTLKSITKTIIDEEIRKAEKFSPPITALYIATTAQRDAPIQEYTRTISQKRRDQDKFEVSILFWEEIESELSKDQNELKRHYPQFFGDAPDTKIIGKREKDISNLNKILNRIDLTSTNSQLSMAPDYIPLAFLEPTDYFNNIVNSATFRLHDGLLEEKLLQFLAKWHEIDIATSNLNYDISDKSNNLILRNLDGLPPLLRKEFNSSYAKIKALIKEFTLLQEDFCRHIHEEYPEIDMANTSNVAKNFYRSIA